MTNYYNLELPAGQQQQRFSVPASKAVFFKAITNASGDTVDTASVILSKGANDVSGAFPALAGLIVNDTDFDTLTLTNTGTDDIRIALYTTEGSFKFAGAASGGTATIPNPLEDTALKNPGAITQDNGDPLEISATGANVDITGEQVTVGNNTIYNGSGDTVNLSTKDDLTGVYVTGGSNKNISLKSSVLRVPTSIFPLTSGSSIHIGDGAFYQINSIFLEALFLYARSKEGLHVQFQQTDSIILWAKGPGDEDGEKRITVKSQNITSDDILQITELTELDTEYNPWFCGCVNLKTFTYNGDTTAGTNWSLFAKSDKLCIKEKPPGGQKVLYVFDPDTGTFKKETT